MSEKDFDPNKHREPLFYTQGGGFVDRYNRFVCPPDGIPSLSAGDLLPEGWSLVPANAAAREMFEQEQDED